MAGGPRDPFSSPAIVPREEEESADENGRRERLTNKPLRIRCAPSAGHGHGNGKGLARADWVRTQACAPAVSPFVKKFH